jgi:hypothetical protein
MVGVARHVLFYTTFMLNLICKAKVWYLDATFKAVQKPFTQLFSIHGFVLQGECMKQVPLCYAIMSRSFEDNASVLTHIKQNMATYIQL